MCYHGDRENLSYTKALELMEDGDNVRRAGWDDKVEYICVNDGEDIVAKMEGEDKMVPYTVTTKDQLVKDWVLLD